jgi:hypothetical protein
MALGTQNAPDLFAALPHACALAILRCLTVDELLRCAEVCRGWRALLRDASLWRRLELRTGGLTEQRLAALLRAATARAGDALQELAVACDGPASVHRALQAAGVADALRAKATLLDAASVAAMHRAAPRLRPLRTDPPAAGAPAEPANEAPGARQCMQLLYLAPTPSADAHARAAAAAIAARTALAGALLTHVRLDTAGAADAVLDTALAARVTSLELSHCRLSPASAPALARLLAGGALRDLHVSGAEHNDAHLLDDAPAAAVLAGALRSNGTLTALALRSMQLWSDAGAHAAALLVALAGHPTLTSLDLTGNPPPYEAPAAAAAALAAALGALVAADAPALRQLLLTGCALGDAGTTPLAEALAGNTHLRALDLVFGDTSEAWARGVLLPAVRANTGLRWLRTDSDTRSHEEAQDVVAARA